MDDLISRQEAIDALKRDEAYDEDIPNRADGVRDAIITIMGLPSAQPEKICIANVNVTLSEEKLKELVEKAKAEIAQSMPTVIEPEIIRCKDCKHFEYDHPYIIQDFPVLGHEVCNAWGDGCKTDENGYCFLAERRTNEPANIQ